MEDDIIGLKSIVYMHNLLTNQLKKKKIGVTCQNWLFFANTKVRKYNNLKKTYQCVILQVIHIYYIVFVST